MSKNAPLAIHEFNPQSKILIMLRNPVEFAYSWYKQSFFTCGEYIKPFRKAILAESDRRLGKKLSPRTKVPSFFYYSEIVRYKEQVQKYVELFGKDKVKVIIYEDFKADNDKTYKDVLSFLGVNVDFIPEFAGINKSREIKNSPVYFMSKDPRVMSLSRKLFPENIRQFVKEQIKKITFREEKRILLDGDLHSYLSTMYHDEVVKISQYLNRDLISFWGFDIKA